MGPGPALVGWDLAQLLLLLLLKVLQLLLMAHSCACAEHMLLLLLLAGPCKWFAVRICWQILGLGPSSCDSTVHAVLCCVCMYVPCCLFCCCCCCVAG